MVEDVRSPVQFRALPVLNYFRVPKLNFEIRAATFHCPAPGDGPLRYLRYLQTLPASVLLRSPGCSVPSNDLRTPGLLPAFLRNQVV
jgi:hypothetical protein